MRKLLRVKRLGVVLGVLLVGSLAMVGIQSFTRGTPVKRVVTFGKKATIPGVGDSTFGRSLELYTGLRLQRGNLVEEVNNGDVYTRLWPDLRSAKRTITVQMYYSQPGKVADTMAVVLKERARAGVRVLLVLDAFGSQNLKAKWADSLREAGVEIGLLRQLHWYSLHNASNRSHVRVVVIDGQLAYTGGFGLADYWLGEGLAPDQWRDSNVRFTGPAVMALQSAFAAAWAECTGELLAGETFFPAEEYKADAGGVLGGVFFSSPTTGSTPGERFVALTIASARRTLYVANSYFVPDDDFRGLLIDARKRGVDVRIMTVSKVTDVKTTWWAGRSRYEELLKGGVRIYEYQPAMMHSKTFIVDGKWGTVGSMNFDNRSLAFNNESNFVFLDAEFGAKMEATFMKDLSRSKEIILSEFEKRPWHNRVVENVSALMSRLL